MRVAKSKTGIGMSTTSVKLQSMKSIAPMTTNNASKSPTALRMPLLNTLATPSMSLTWRVTNVPTGVWSKYCNRNRETWR